MDKRQGFPPVYDFQYKSYEEDIPFWLDISRQNPGVNLELGCGTGRVAMKLAQTGLEMVGIDNDLWMLRYLKNKIEMKGLQNLKILQSDMTGFNLHVMPGSIFIPCNTFSTLTAQQRKLTLACVFHHLHEGGLFSASLPNPLFLQGLPKNSSLQFEETFFHPVDHDPVEVSSGWSRGAAKFTIHWRYDRLQSDGRVTRYEFSVHHSLDSSEIHLHELKSTGFRSIEFFGGFDRSAYTRDAEYLIIIARK